MLLSVKPIGLNLKLIPKPYLAGYMNDPVNYEKFSLFSVIELGKIDIQNKTQELVNLVWNDKISDERKEQRKKDHGEAGFADSLHVCAAYWREIIRDGKNIFKDSHERPAKR